MIRKLDLGYMPSKAEEGVNNNNNNKNNQPSSTASSSSSSASTGPNNSNNNNNDGVTTETQSATSTQSLQPNIPKDFDLFLNLVDFCKTILPTTCTELFTRWVYVSYFIIYSLFII